MLRSRKDMRPYQNRTVSFIAHRFNQWSKSPEGAALWIDMGLGKTVSILTALQDLFDDFAISKVLVIGPKFVAQHTWPAELQGWSHLNMTVAVAVGDTQTRLAALASKAQITCINRENIVWLIDMVSQKKLRWPWDVVVIDEASSFKSTDAKRFRALNKAIKIKKPFVIEATGTPAGNGYMDIWPQIMLVDGGKRLYDTVGAYRERYFDAIQRDFGCDYFIKPGADVKIQEALRDIVIVMETEDYLTLPPMITVDIEVQLSERSRALYDEMQASLYLHLSGSDIVALSGAALITKLQQIASGAVYSGSDEERVTHELHSEKLEALDRIVDEANGEPVMVAYVFDHERAAIMKRYKGARQIKTAQDITDWNDGKIPMLVVHPASVGHGLNLQFGGSILVWYSLCWSLELFLQTVKRLHRSGQKAGRVLVYMVQVAKTVDQRIAKALATKTLTQKTLLKALKE